MSPNNTKRLLQVVILLVVVGLSLYLRSQRSGEPADDDHRPHAEQRDDASPSGSAPVLPSGETAAPAPTETTPARPAEPKGLEVKEPVRERASETPPAAVRKPAQAAPQPTDRPRLLTSVPNQTIRDREGEVVFRGTVDLSSTLRRIADGRRLSHPNDGTVFQNRERRLPGRPSGHYREWVHPTPNLSGPGPQRVVTGEDGEFYYTPDHYRTFRKLNL